MGINMPQQQASPIERLATLLGVVNTGRDIYDKFKKSSLEDTERKKALDLEAQEKDAASPLSASARDAYQKELGSPLADTVSLYQIKKDYPSLASVREMRFKSGIEKEAKLAEIKARGDQDFRVKQLEVAKSRADKGKLPADKVLTTNEGNTIPTMLGDIRETISANSDMFGPFAGRVASFNPYNEKMQTINAQVKAASQAFGRHMEGGVLRKEDEAKYEKMFPQATDTPEVAMNKLTLVERLLAQKQQSNIEALRSSGYDVVGVDQKLKAPDAPAVLGRNRPKSSDLFQNANAGSVKPPKGKVHVSNGKESYFIDPNDLEGAAKDGFKVIR